MNALLAPGIALFSRLKYTAKFMVFTVIFMTPFIIVTGMLAYNLSNDVTVLENEQKGVRYIMSLRQLIQHIPQHRGMTNAYLNGKTSFEDKILAKRPIIDEKFQAALTVDSELGETLNTGDTLKQLQAQWQEIRDTSMDMPATKAFNAHTDLIEKIIGFIHSIASQSGIILDSELDTFYLLDTIVTKGPNITETMGKMRGQGSGIAAAQFMGEKSKYAMTTIMINFDGYVKGIDQNMTYVFETNPSLKPVLGPLHKAAMDSIHVFDQIIENEILQSTAVTADPDAVFSAGTKAIDAVYALYDASAEQANILLGERISADNIILVSTLSMIIVALLIAGYLFLAFYASTMGTLNDIKTAARQLADGELTARVKTDTKDEITEIVDSFNMIADSFSHLVGEVASTTNQVASAAEELSVITGQTTNGIIQQTSATDQVATSVSEMSSSIQEVARHAAGAADASMTAHEETSAGQAVVSKAVSSINALSSEISNATGVIKQLEANSEEIGSILDVIRGIAEQTNLLALNAAIEAARAGEQGRGFAVVADEVRTLARRTQESTEQIHAMIERLQEGSRNAVTAMEASNEKAAESVESAQQAGNSLSTIFNAVTTINDMNNQIAAAAEEQATVSEGVNKNVVEIYDVSQQTKDGAEQTLVSSNELARLAEQLQTLVSKFKTS
ncbi:MAG: methyl-accepting chemotaxis protein [Gammaproteobacteria bacterium]|nr:methyl-accepting chemotaxis protein [Gammaproteobacteria bacterium]